MTTLRIIGAGGHGRVVADIAVLCGYRDITFLDARYPNLSESGPWKISGEPLSPFHGPHALGIGDNHTRLSLMMDNVTNFKTLIHPSAIVSQYASIGQGSIVCAGAVVGPFAKIGRACIINTGASVDHDCVIGDAVHISPGARLGGGVKVGKLAWIGIGAAVREYTSIGNEAFIAAGAAVIADIQAGQRVGGIPAREF